MGKKKLMNLYMKEVFCIVGRKVKNFQKKIMKR